MNNSLINLLMNIYLNDKEIACEFKSLNEELNISMQQVTNLKIECILFLFNSF